MKIFKKLLILNWHYISRELIHLDGINFLTGKNAAGKSTVIDAMQLLLLGDATGSYFNKAANERSRRTLLGYAKGELSDTDVNFNYLRSGRFTTHLAMEIYDDVKKESFVLGFLMDVEGDDSNDKRYYWMKGSLPDHGFVRDNRSMSKEEIKALFKKSGVRHTFYGTQTDYRNDFKVKMGHLNDKYFELFKKAVAFKPDTDIKRFITEFICETENQVDITHMQDNIRYYERLKQEAEEIQAMVEHLERIQGCSQDYEREEQSEKLYGFLIRLGELEALKLELEEKIHGQQTLEEDQTQKKLRLVMLEQDLATGQLEMERKRNQLADFEPYRMEQECKRDIHSLKEINRDLDRDIEKVTQRLEALLRRWTAALVSVGDGIQGESSHSENEVESFQRAAEALSERKFHGSLKELKLITDQQKHQADIRSIPLEEEHRQRKNELEETQVTLQQLQKGKKPYSEGVLRLKGLLEVELAKKAKKPVMVQMFCEGLEIADEKWRNAVEGYLHTQKFNLLVDPVHFKEAIRLYDRHKKEMKLFGVGLVDGGKILERKPHATKGSLAEAVQSKDPLIQAYADHLLGSVMKCEDVVLLRNHKIAITPGCMLYKNYVATQIHPNRYEIPYIGEKALEQQIFWFEKQMILLQQEQIKLEKMLLPLRTLRSLDSLSVENLVDYEDARTKQEKLERNLGQIRILQDTLEQLDLNAVVLLKEELENLVERQRTMQREIAGLEARQKQDHERITALQNREIPELKNRIHQTGSAYFTDYDHDYRAVVGEPRYEQEFKRLKSHEKIRDNFDQSYKTATNRKDAAFQNLVDERNAFEKNHRRDLGLMAKTNERYDALLDTLLGTELPAYMEKIEEAIQKAQAEFKDDFISKLKNNIDTVNRQIDALNASLKSIKFGKDTYRFNVRPNEYYKKYYDMIMDDMLLTGYNLFSVDFQTKYKEPLDELFKKIVDVGEGAITAAERAELEKNIEKYTDYRTYLDFDLIVTDEMGEKSRLSRMLNKKSGGETQTPFFISVLASFHRLYSLNDRRREDTMRLIIFDEAFSKMDHERIAESLKLLREMKFQTLISAPTEKIANIAPYVDKTLCVLRSERTTRVREWDKIVMEEV